MHQWLIAKFAVDKGLYLWPDKQNTRDYYYIRHSPRPKPDCQKLRYKPYIDADERKGNDAGGDTAHY